MILKAKKQGPNAKNPRPFLTEDSSSGVSARNRALIYG